MMYKKYQKPEYLGEHKKTFENYTITEALEFLENLPRWAVYKSAAFAVFVDKFGTEPFSKYIG